MTCLRLYYILALVLLLAVGSGLNAHEIHLKNGTVIKTDLSTATPVG